MPCQVQEIYESFPVKNVVLFTVKVRAKSASVGNIFVRTKDNDDCVPIFGAFPGTQLSFSETRATNDLLGQSF